MFTPFATPKYTRCYAANCRRRDARARRWRAAFYITAAALVVLAAGAVW